MENNIYMHDFDCFYVFKNVIQSKLKEAQQHLKKLEIYKTHPELFSTHLLNEILYIHEEQSDFITIAYKQCNVWRTQSLLLNQIEKINGLEEIIKKLETTIYHILFIIEHIQRNKDTLPHDKMEEILNIDN
ncbi:MAG: hypothetical protein V4544_05760 [Pseudomonadota bacterium]